MAPPQKQISTGRFAILSVAKEEEEAGVVALPPSGNKKRKNTSTFGSDLLNVKTKKNGQSSDPLVVLFKVEETSVASNSAPTTASTPHQPPKPTAPPAPKPSQTPESKPPQANPPKQQKKQKQPKQQNQKQKQPPKQPQQPASSSSNTKNSKNGSSAKTFSKGSFAILQHPLDPVQDPAPPAKTAPAQRPAFSTDPLAANVQEKQQFLATEQSGVAMMKVLFGTGSTSAAPPPQPQPPKQPAKTKQQSPAKKKDSKPPAPLKKTKMGSTLSFSSGGSGTVAVLQHPQQQPTPLAAKNNETTMAKKPKFSTDPLAVQHKTQFLAADSSIIMTAFAAAPVVSSTRKEEPAPPKAAPPKQQQQQKQKQQPPKQKQKQPQQQQKQKQQQQAKVQAKKPASSAPKTTTSANGSTEAKPPTLFMDSFPTSEAAINGGASSKTVSTGKFALLHDPTVPVVAPVARPKKANSKTPFAAENPRTVASKQGFAMESGRTPFAVLSIVETSEPVIQPEPKPAAKKEPALVLPPAEPDAQPVGDHTPHPPRHMTSAPLADAPKKEEEESKEETQQPEHRERRAARRRYKGSDAPLHRGVSRTATGDSDLFVRAPHAKPGAPAGKEDSQPAAATAAAEAPAPAPPRERRSGRRRNQSDEGGNGEEQTSAARGPPTRRGVQRTATGDDDLLVRAPTAKPAATKEEVTSEDTKPAAAPRQRRGGRRRLGSEEDADKKDGPAPPPPRRGVQRTATGDDEMFVRGPGMRKSFSGRNLKIEDLDDDDDNDKKEDKKPAADAAPTAPRQKRSGRRRPGKDDTSASTEGGAIPPPPRRGVQRTATGDDEMFVRAPTQKASSDNSKEDDKKPEAKVDAAPRQKRSGRRRPGKEEASASAEGGAIPPPPRRGVQRTATGDDEMFVRAPSHQRISIDNDSKEDDKKPEAKVDAAPRQKRSGRRRPGKDEGEEKSGAIPAPPSRGVQRTATGDDEMFVRAPSHQSLRLQPEKVIAPGSSSESSDGEGKKDGAPVAPRQRRTGRRRKGEEDAPAPRSSSREAPATRGFHRQGTGDDDMLVRIPHGHDKAAPEPSLPSLQRKVSGDMAPRPPAHRRTEESERAAEPEVVTEAKPTEKVEKHVLVLVSLQSMDREVNSNQQHTTTVLDANKVNYKTLDGADPANKEKRNELFAISGLRAKYPQFFKVGDDGKPSFWGDYEKFQMTNDDKQIAKELDGVEPMPVPRKRNSMMKKFGRPSSSSLDDEDEDDGIPLATAKPAPSTNTAPKEEPKAEEPAATKKAESKSEDNEPVVQSRSISFSDKAEEKSESKAPIVQSRSISFSDTVQEKILTEPETDITVYGATSFVAKHMLSYIMQVSVHLPRTLKVTLAGRNSSKITAMMDQLTSKMENLVVVKGGPADRRVEFDTFIAECSEVEKLRAMAARTRVVISFTGPYMKYGSNVVEACCKTGCDYLDITGEVTWAMQMREKCGELSKRNGSRIVSLCGFDSVPSDLAVFHAVKQFKKTCGRAAKVEKATTWHALDGCANAGTVHTVLEIPFNVMHMISKSVPFLLEDPLALTHPMVRKSSENDAIRNRLAKAEWYNQLPMVHTNLMFGCSSPFMMSIINAKVVHATAIARKYGPNFVYYERYLPVGFRYSTVLKGFSIIPAVLTQIGMMIGAAALKFPILGALIAHLLFPVGSGMSDQDCQKGFAEVYAEVEGPPNVLGKVDKANCYIKFKGDPGNWVTAQCVTEAALCLLLDKTSLPARSEDGFGTPAEILGGSLLKRLKESKVRPVEVTTDVRKAADKHEWKMFNA